MSKGYIVAAHRSPANPKKRDNYIKLALPALEKMGAKFLASTTNITTKENGVNERIVVIEFESYKKAIEAYESVDYQEALKALNGGSDRDFRIFEGL